jgi:predicted outer membrane repeat protein
VLDGFTVSGGGTFSLYSGIGGGMYINNGSPTARNVIFAGNSASQGAGLYVNNGSPALRNVTFSNNEALYGCGIYSNHSSPTLTNVTFSDNRCKFIISEDEEPDSYGSGMYSIDSSPTLVNVTFFYNEATYGGGMYNKNSTVSLLNVTLSFNGGVDIVGFKGAGGGIYNAENSNLLIQNSILWGNWSRIEGAQIYNISSTVTISDSVVQDGWAGGFNIITADPHLGEFGDYGGRTATVPILPGSSAQDVADAAQCLVTDQRGMARPQGPACDLGAFEAGAFLTVAVVGNGAVTSQPAGIDCPTGRCLIDYALGTIVTLTAASQTNPFAGWSGACTGMGPCIVTLTAGQSVTATFGPNIYRVTPAGVTSGDCGTTWANSCGLQYALTTLAAPGDELWVARGIYKPTAGTDRNISFQLRPDIALYGGFAMTETAREQRNWKVNVTTLSGDIGIPGNSNDNSYHVVNGSGGSGAMLDGFTVIAGNADGPWPHHDAGGGMVIDDYGSGSPAVRNVTFTGNNARRGGGMYNTGYLLLTNVTFSNNTATSTGGGLQNYMVGTPLLINVTFHSNSAVYGGGGMYDQGMGSTLINVTFDGNSAANGGGLALGDEASTSLTNVTFHNNSATSGSGGGISAGVYSFITIRNSIFWGNVAVTGSQLDSPGAVDISDSVVQDGWAGGSNIITADPLLGTFGDYGGSTSTIPILPGSSAQDVVAASQCPATDQRGMTRPQGPACDLGAFEIGSFLNVVISVMVLSPVNLPASTVRQVIV